jgi:hypothetical protein
MSRKNKPSSVRHTRAVALDRSKRPTSAPPDEQIEARLSEVVHPATYSQLALFHQMGLRERTLSLPVMVAFVLSLIWRQIGTVSEAVRVLRREGFLWSAPVTVSQQAVSERLRTLPAALFEGILEAVLPDLLARHAQRSRPASPLMEAVGAHFSAIVAFDGSTLDALLRKVGLLRDQPSTPLGGRMAALLDISSLVPRRVWYEPESQAHDQQFWQRALAYLERGMLVIFDLGFVNHGYFDALTERGVSFITRLKKNARFEVVSIERQGSALRSSIIGLGSAAARCQHPLRLVEVLYGGTWYRYVTNVLDESVLTPEQVAALYRSRWRIEDAFKTVKRLLGLAYFFGGSVNTIGLQLWMTWLLYAVLVDLTDDVAEALGERFASISMEMVYRGLYHFTQAYHRGEATDPVRYLAEGAKDLGIIKRKRRRPPRGLTSSSEP